MYKQSSKLRFAISVLLEQTEHDNHDDVRWICSMWGKHVLIIVNTEFKKIKLHVRASHEEKAQFCGGGKKSQNPNKFFMCP